MQLESITCTIDTYPHDTVPFNSKHALERRSQSTVIGNVVFGVGCNVCLFARQGRTFCSPLVLFTSFIGMSSALSPLCTHIPVPTHVISICYVPYRVLLSSHALDSEFVIGTPGRIGNPNNRLYHLNFVLDLWKLQDESKTREGSRERYKQPSVLYILAVHI